jgi:hypothetical protein
MEALAFFYAWCQGPRAPGRSLQAPAVPGLNLGSVVALHAMGLLRHHPEASAYSLTDAGLRAFEESCPPIDRYPLRIAIRSALVHLRRGQIQVAIQLLDAFAAAPPPVNHVQEEPPDV